MKKRMLAMTMALAAVAFAGDVEAGASAGRVHRGCHKLGVRRPGRNGTTHHHTVAVKKAACSLSGRVSPRSAAIAPRPGDAPASQSAVSIEKVSGQGRRTVGKDRFFQGSGDTVSP